MIMIDNVRKWWVSVSEIKRFGVYLFFVVTSPLWIIPALVIFGTALGYGIIDSIIRGD